MGNNLDISRRALGSSCRHPDITFFRSGRIDISSRVSRILGIEAGDVIDVAITKSDYYLYVRAKGGTLLGRYEAQCYPTNKGPRRNYFRTYCRKITDLILSVSGGDKAQIIGGQVCEFDNIGKAIIIIPSFNLSK